MSGVRAWAAHTWLKLLFWHTTHAPWVLWVLRPMILFFAWRCSHLIRESTLANARHLLGDASTRRQREAMGRGVMTNFFEAVVDFGRNRRRSREEVLGRIERVEGLDRYERARALGRGAIIVTAHLGPFETAVASLRQREERVHVVFRRDASPFFESLRTEQRRRLGVTEAPIDDGVVVWFRLRDALRRDEVVLMQGDRVMAGQAGVRMPFLGGHVELPDGPVKLARITGAPIIPTFAVYTPTRRVRVVIEEPMTVGDGPGDLSVSQALAHLAGVLAGVVRRYPEQWLALEKLWLEDRAQPAGVPAPAPLSARATPK